MLANHRNGTIYIGVTGDLAQRVWDHRNGTFGGFTADHRVHRLVWYDPHARMVDAIAREKSMKAWKRAWKIRLIEVANPDWSDLYSTLNQ